MKFAKLFEFEDDKQVLALVRKFNDEEEFAIDVYCTIGAINITTSLEFETDEDLRKGFEKIDIAKAEQVKLACENAVKELIQQD